MVEDEKFFAWLDGELPPEEAAQVEAAVAADPRLSRLRDNHRAMTAGLRSAFSEVEMQPVPERLREAFNRNDDRVINLGSVRERRPVRRIPPVGLQMAALAATLAFGVFVGSIFDGLPFGGSSSPVSREAGRLIASAELEEALYARLASVPAESGPQIGLTFRETSGSICRTFEYGSMSGLACREDGDWRIRSLFQSAGDQLTEYRMASGQDPRLMEMVDAIIEGEPFDASQEKAAQAKDWR